MARHNLDEHLVEQASVDGPPSSTQDAEVAYKETAAVGRGICDASDGGMEIVMDVASAQGEGIAVTLEVIKTHDYVMQPVWSVENTIVAIEYLSELGIVRWREPRGDSVGKAYEEWIPTGFKSIDVAQLIWRSAGELSSAVAAQSWRADSLGLRRMENAIKEWSGEPLKLISGKKEDLVLYYRSAQRSAHVSILAECFGKTFQSIEEV